MANLIKPPYPKLCGGSLARDLVVAYPVYDKGGATLRDVGPRSLHGTFGASTAAPAFGAGPYGAQLVFDGTNDYASIAALPLASTQRLTLSFWVYWATSADDDDLLMETSTNYNSNTGAFCVFWNASTGSANGNTGKLTVAIRGSAGQNAVYFNRPSAAVWHHILLAIDTTRAAAAGQVDLWVDGVAQTPTVWLTAGGTPTLTDQTWYLLSRAGTTLFASARLADLRVWTRLLTADEIARLVSDPWEQYRLPRFSSYIYVVPPSTVTWSGVVPVHESVDQSPIAYVEAIATPIDDATEPIDDGFETVEVDGDLLDASRVTVTPTSFGGSKIRGTFPFLFDHAYTIVFSVKTANGTINTLTLTFTTRRRMQGGQAIAHLIAQGESASPAIVHHIIRRATAAPGLVNLVIRPSGVAHASSALVHWVVIPRTGGVLQAHGAQVEYLVSEFAQQVLATIGALTGTAEVDPIVAGADMYGTAADAFTAGADLATTQSEGLAVIGADVERFSREVLATIGALTGTAEADQITVGALIAEVPVLATLDVDIQSLAQQDIEEAEP